MTEPELNTRLQTITPPDEAARAAAHAHWAALAKPLGGLGSLETMLEDAAALDGCGPLRYLWQICLPLIGPTVGCLAFFHACGYWGNTLYARTFLTDESRFPLSLVLNAALIQNRAADVLAQGGAASAAAVQMAEFALCVLSALPMIVLFLLLKRQIRSLDLDSGLLP